MVRGSLQANLKKHCEFLAHPDLDGRVPGREGNRRARLYIQAQFEAAGLTPLFGDSWFQPYATRAGGPGIEGVNVGGMLAAENPPTAPTLLIGAHFDHLEGIPGADDNASSVAIMIELARNLGTSMDTPPPKNLVFVAFDTEERPFYLTPDMGSVYFHAHCPIKPIDCALIMDLCGHDFPIPGREDALFLMGADSSPALARLLPTLAAQNVTPFIIDDRYGGDKSDYYTFKQAGVPYVFVSVGWWECYHRPCDTVERLNYTKMAAICRLLENMVAGLQTAVIDPGRADTLELEAHSISALVGQQLPPDRPTLDAVVAKIASTYLGRG